MLNLRVRPALARGVDPVARALVRARITPDALTLAGTLGVCVGALGFYPRGMFFTATAIVFACVLTDLVDGTMARHRGSSSPFGAWLDSTCDRVADAAMFGGLVLWFAGRGDDRVLLALTLYCLVAGSVVSYAKARAEGLGLRCDVGLAERGERVGILLLGTLFHSLGVPYALAASLVLLAVASTITVAQRLAEVRRQSVLAGG